MTDPGPVAERLFGSFMVPLVLGGNVTPGKPIGGAVAVAIPEGRARGVGDVDTFSTFELARSRAARRLAPVDRVLDVTPAEWIASAALHDLLQTTHPDFDGAFRRNDATKLLHVVESTIEAVPPVADLEDALRRHTLFARVFELERTDTDVSFWIGKRKFRGGDPPSTLLAWPDLRRVKVEKVSHGIATLPEAGAVVGGGAFRRAMASWIVTSPLTDLATMDRPSIPFAFGSATASLLATSGGMTLVLRALARRDADGVDTAFARAFESLARAASTDVLAAVLALAVERESARMHGALPDTGESPRAEGVRRLARAFLRRAHDHGAIAMTPVAAQELSRRTDGGDEQSLGLFEAVWPAFALGLERRHRVPTTT